MISLAPGTKVFLACSPVDLRNGFDGLAAKVQQVIGADPFSGHLFIFRGKRGDYLKGLYWDGSGLWLIASGIIVAILSRDVLRLGLGILMFTSGFCILETATESSLLLYGLLNISDLLLALVIANLAALPPDPTSARRRRGEKR